MLDDYMFLLVKSLEMSKTPTLWEMYALHYIEKIHHLFVKSNKSATITSIPVSPATSIHSQLNLARTETKAYSRNVTRIS